MSTKSILLGKNTQHKDHLSAYKLVLLVVMDEHMSYLDSMDDSMACKLMFSLLELINVPDMELKTLLSKLSHVMPPSSLQALMTRLGELEQGGLDGLFYLMKETPERLLCDSYNKMHESQLDRTVFTNSVDAFLHDNSVFGLFVRRLNLSFEMLSFHEACDLHCSLHRFIETCLRKHTEADRRTDTTEEADPMDEGTSQLTEDDLICTEDDESSSINCEKSLVEDRKEVGMISQRQSEIFISQQANLLNYNERLALPPRQLQARINQLLNNNPQLIETHFLQYLNYLRVREYNASMGSLYNYFDRTYLSLSNAPSNQGNQAESNLHDDVNNHRFYRYAALNVATAHYRFGHREQAILALREAIKIAHQTNDSICLQYALDWLYRLGVYEKDAEATDGAYLINKLIHSSSLFNLPNLMSLACLSNAKHAYVHAADPALVLESITLSDLSHTSNNHNNKAHSNTGHNNHTNHSHNDHSSHLLVTSSTQKASLWNAYGNDELCLVNCLILLETTSSITLSLSSSSTKRSSSSPTKRSSSSPPTLMTSSETTHCNNEEMESLAFGHLCRLLSKEGKFEQATELLQHAKKKYPHSGNQSQVLLFCEQQMSFYDSLLQGKFTQSDQSIQNMASINGLESSYCRCIHLLESGELEGSLKLLGAVLKACDGTKSPASHANHLYTRCLILEGCLRLHHDDTSASLHAITTAHNVAKRNHYRYLQAITLCNMATLQLKTKKFKSAFELIKQALPVIFENQNVIDQATALFIYAKCNLALIKWGRLDSSSNGSSVGVSSSGVGGSGGGVGVSSGGVDGSSGCVDGSNGGVDGSSGGVGGCIIGGCIVGGCGGLGDSDGCENISKSKNADEDCSHQNDDNNNNNINNNNINRGNHQPKNDQYIKDNNNNNNNMNDAFVGGEAWEVARDMTVVVGVVCEKFERMKAYSRLKEVLVFQSLLYHSLGMKGQRNRSASMHARLTHHLRNNNNDAVNRGTNVKNANNTSLLYLNVL